MDRKQIDLKIDQAAEAAKKLAERAFDTNQNVANAAEGALDDAQHAFARTSKKGEHRMTEAVVAIAHRLQESATKLAHRAEEWADRVARRSRR